MSELRDSFYRALEALQQRGQMLQVVMQGQPWACCASAVHGGPGRCVCWFPVYDMEQTKPPMETVVDLALGCTDLDIRDGMCGDCAYRPNSPERAGDEDVQADAAQLEQLAATGVPFFCHDGMRRPVAWCHPKGMRIPVAAGQGDADYQPPIVNNVPYRADGRPGLLCAGWSARRRALAARSAAEVNRA